jgi:hypothetical protein
VTDGLTELLPDQLIRPGEAAKALALSARSLTRVDPEVLPQVRVPGLPGTVRYRLSDVQRLIAGEATGPAVEQLIRQGTRGSSRSLS